MSVVQDLTHICVEGSRESIIKMLNAAIRNVGTGNVIVDGDDIETLNAKIREEDGKHTLRIRIPDLLDEPALSDERIQEKKAAFDAEEEESNGCTSARMIDIEKVSECDNGMKIELVLYECEGCAYYSDWLYWGDIAFVFDCRVTVDNDLYRNGCFEEHCSTIVFEIEDGIVKETRNGQVVTEDEGEDYIEEDEEGPAGDWVIDENGHAVIPEGTKGIEDYAFAHSTELISVEMPQSVESIGACAFSECTKLTSVKISENVKSIDYGAFSNCINLESIKISDGVTCIADYTFCNCRSLKKVSLPDSITWIGSHAFENCVSLESISIPNGVSSIGVAAFRNCPLSSVNIPDGVKVIGACCFEGCTRLESVNLPSQLRYISDQLFSGCRTLKAVEIPDNVKLIGNEAFCECSSITSIIIPDSVTDIEDFAFADCFDLKKVKLPEHLDRLGDNVFADCAFTICSSGKLSPSKPDGKKEEDELPF